MFELNITLENSEARDLALSIGDSINSLIDFLSSTSGDELSRSAYSLYVLSKLYNLLPKEKGDTATNETALSYDC